ncbi:nucleotidyltransferase family protein [Paenibacillus gansuensis]|uniref:Nucleotidyltransferase family protein n=1 Tax=Paenibacillus gansuensis TaxID=306542 RepID=A0ABW5PAF6_9BACL
MIIHSKHDILQLISEDEWMMDIIRAAKRLELPDWWVCAGFVRTKVWDVLHGFDERTPLADVDVVYFDKSNTDEAVEKEYEQKLHLMLPGIPWSVKNQARMHKINGIPPYVSSTDAISKFPETVTSLGVKLDDQDRLILTAPHGIKDVLDMRVKPTPYFCESQDRLAVYKRRITEKNFSAKWGKISVDPM